MPRRNRRTPHIPYTPSRTNTNKRRFSTRQQAQAAADYRMLLNPELQLYVYREIDGGWYLTSTPPQAP